MLHSELDVSVYADVYWSIRRVVAALKPTARFRLLVTGSREWDDQLAIESMLFGVSAGAGTVGCHLTDGKCHTGGADWLAHLLVEFNVTGAGKDWTTHREPADWKTHGKAAGSIRNQKMVDMGHDLCVGFPDPAGSPGTRDCMTRAKKAGIPTYLVTSRTGKWALEEFASYGVRPAAETMF